MIQQYFIFKIKDEFLPDYIKNNNIFKSYSNSIFFIDQKYIRKLKIQNIENSISENEKKILEFLLNKDFTLFLTEEECNKLKNYCYSSSGLGVSGSSGYMGTSGTCGTSGNIGTSVIISMPVKTSYHNNLVIVKKYSSIFFVYFRFIRKFFNKYIKRVYRNS